MKWAEVNDMAIAFVLRYQEPCVAADPSAAYGTKTETKTYGEHGDTDHQGAENLALSRATVMAGTTTKTAVLGEANDADPSKTSLRAFPVIPWS
jgi:hypothetical protein